MPAETQGIGARVLVIDDDETIRDLLTHVLTNCGHDVTWAVDGHDGLQKLYAQHPGLVVLDVDMPGMDGWQTLARVRELGRVPVLMLTAKDAELEKVRALRGGADDYLTKPFGQQELAARVEALLRRVGAEEGETERFYSDERLTVDYQQRLVTLRDRELRLTPLEYRLLIAFVRHPGQILSPDQLIELAWQDPLVQSEQVKLYVGRLRGKLESPGAIETVRGFGYRYLPSVAVASQS
jgi:DNA-binding response OmpR family regulator